MQQVRIFSRQFMTSFSQIMTSVQVVDFLMQRLILYHLRSVSLCNISEVNNEFIDFEKKFKGQCMPLLFSIIAFLQKQELKQVPISETS